MEQDGPDLEDSESQRKHEPYDKPVLGLVDTDRTLLIGFSLLWAVMIMAQWLNTASSGGETILVQRAANSAPLFQLEINEATWVEWMQLEGVGETTARKIVQNREEFGPFTSLEDVQRVKGIGPKTFAKMQAHLNCADCEALSGE